MLASIDKQLDYTVHISYRLDKLREKYNITEHPFLYEGYIMQANYFFSLMNLGLEPLEILDHCSSLEIPIHLIDFATFKAMVGECPANNEIPIGEYVIGLFKIMRPNLAHLIKMTEYNLLYGELATTQDIKLSLNRLIQEIEKYY